jgi:protein-disulfide isomerase
MSSRAEQKAKAREARLAAERAAQAAAARRRRMIMFGGILAIAAVIAVVAVIVSQTGDDEAAIAQDIALFDGIPQSGTRLGQDDAPVVVEEYADLQCPHCAAFSADRLPPIVTDFVRTGEVQLDMQLVSILGPDSGTAARYALAAGRQDRLWEFTKVFLAEQGATNSGYVTRDFVREVGEQVPGLDVDRVLAEAGDPAVARQLRASQDAFVRHRLTGTPSFRVGPRDGQMKTVSAEELPDAIQEALDEAKAGAAKD